MALVDDDLNELYELYEKDPDSYEVNARLGLYLSAIRKTYLHSEPYLLKALSGGRTDKYTRRIIISLGGVYLMKGFPEIAAEIYRVAIRALPQDIDFLYHLADQLFRIGREEDAYTAYGRANEVIYGAARRKSEEDGEPITHLLEPKAMICRFFGEMGHRLDLYLKCRELGLIDGERAILLAASDVLINRSFAEYWEDHIDIYYEPDEIAEIAERYGDNWVYTDYYGLPDGRTMHRMLAHRVVQALWEKDNHPPLLSVKPEQREKGWAYLKKHGMPEDAWFVSMHVREAGFFSEDVPWSNNLLRNAEVESYFPAMREITRRGGWIVRIGDPSMTPLPPMENVIDYACGEEQEPWMDMFFIGESRFYFGMASGPSALPPNFGVPSLGTNWFPLGWWPFCTGDMFVPKRLRKKEDGRLLTTTESLAPPFFGAMEPLFFERYGVEVIDNTADELCEAAAEMIDRLDGVPFSADDEALHDTYRKVADPYNVGLITNISTGMLKRHPELLS